MTLSTQISPLARLAVTFENRRQTQKRLELSIASKNKRKSQFIIDLLFIYEINYIGNINAFVKHIIHRFPTSLVLLETMFFLSVGSLRSGWRDEKH